MAKSNRKKKKTSTKGVGRFQVVMTDRIRLLLLACFVCSFLVVGAIILWMAWS
jgi:hypothetical protein